jgi:hypothetical protein
LATRAEVTVVQTPFGAQVHYGGRDLYPARPVPDTERRIAGLTVPPDSIVLWCSPVLWHGLDRVAAKLSAGSVIIGCEADPALADVTREALDAARSTTEAPVCFYTATDPALRDFVDQLAERRFRRVVELTTSAAALANRGLYRRLRDRIDAQISTVWQNRLTRASMGRLWIRNIIQNAPVLARATPIPPLVRPVVVCGAGPSLDDAIPFMIARRHAITIVAVDTALLPLVQHGIVPDHVVALEAQLINTLDFLGAPHDEYALIADLTSHPAALSMHSRFACTVTAFDRVSLIDRLSRVGAGVPVLPPHGSVGVTAVSLALAHSSAPVIVTGLDFAVRAGTTHARGAPAALRTLANATRVAPARDAAFGLNLEPITAADGTRAYTTLVLSGYARQLAHVTHGRATWMLVPRGIACGVPPLSVEEATRLVDEHASSAGDRAPSIQAASPAETRHDLPALRTFIEQEIASIDRFRRADSRAERERGLQTCDYLTVEFVHRESVDVMDPSTWHQLMVASSYYRAQWVQSADRASVQPQS